MAETWELICHHTYRGIPGVVVDTAPAGASHGRAWGLDDGDFLADGIAPGSGAVKLYKQGSIHVGAEAAAWRSIGGVKGEVTFRRQPAGAAFLIDGDSFAFHIRSDALVAWFSSYPAQYAEIVSTFDPVGPLPYRVPVGQWVTLGFMHDGFGTMELHAEGQVVARRSGIYAPVNAPGPAGVNIGNARTLDLFLNGEIDEVKIWRLNPRRFDEDFYGRPMSRATAECWKRFRAELAAAFQRHPDCAKRVAEALKTIIDGLIRQAMAKGPETAKHLLDAAQQYGQLWRQGHVDHAGMVKVFTDLMAWLDLVGLAPGSDAGFAALLQSDCLKEILAEVKPPHCDPEAERLLRSVADARARSGPLPAS